MAYKTKFLHFKTKASYEAERAKTTAGTEERKVFDAYISFIDEGPMICTWGKEYKCDISASEVEALVNAGKISPATVAPLIAGTAAVGTSTKYAREDHRHPEQVNITGNAATATTATNLASAPLFINNGNIIKITVGNKTSTEFTIPYASKTSSAETLMYGRNIFLDGDVTGSTTESFNGSKNVTINTTISTINAEKLTGIINVDRLPEIPIEKIPAAALERLFVVDSQSAAMSVDVQEGDVVQISSGGPMYFCVSESASTFATKFKVFTAGAATSVPWSGVTGAPTKLSQFTNDSGFITSVPAQTWDSITGKPSTFTPSTHTQAYTTLTGSTTTANQAIVSSGTANGWTLKTLGSLAFSSATIPTKTSQLTNDSGFLTSVPAQSWSSITGKPTTLDGYGITDAIKNTTTATATTLAAGASATAVYDKATNKFTFGIPRGATGPAGTYTAGSGISISGNTISADIPVALPNPYALTINGTSYTGSSVVSISTSKPLSVRMLTSSTVNAGYSYSCGTSKAISTLNGFSSTNPDSVIISSAKLTFTASNVIKMDGLDDLSGTWYIYCLSYMANSKIAVNGAVYA